MNNLSLQQHQNSTTRPFAENETINHIDPLTPNEIRYPVYMDPLNDTTRYPITLQPSQPSLITHHVTHNQENQSPFNSVAINNQSPIQSTSTFINFNQQTDGQHQKLECLLKKLECNGKHCNKSKIQEKRAESGINYY
ncbi:uncharacterized protein OCT59_012180 [Rhizophagus irregularis]|uniref:Uncharacterized protein n=2 Tax=Rhizophagus irregularis TaxID=588596 RepID=A0A015L9E5_RHIIW|nr:hypothetical protein RirG_034280 [Rhizophagus irregularis DAOM 197198w]UZO01074.1 hypothetical protein OCT59_012180 [Rhizophagus irregularis]CAB4476959.1 unnamed protein product [Rhizophagus irregularis]CAB5193807.1 unnamed protein product [Rhizophagus irregularis]